MNSVARSVAVVSSLTFLSLLLPRAACGEERTVSSVTELVAALEAMKDDSSNTVILAPGSYDVSGCQMPCNDADKSKYLWSTSHVAISHLTLKGGGESPEDTVIYGDRSQRILYMWQGKLMNLTVSNGCTRAGENVGGGGVLGRNTSSLLSNVVVTCCEAYSGGGVSTVKCIDSTITKCVGKSHSGGAGSCVVTGGSITDNETQGYAGGCAWSTCTGVDILRNRAGTYGGGVFCSTVKDCLIAGNASSLAGGGVFYNQLGDYKVEGCTIISNSTSSTDGGGGVGFSGSAARKLVVKDCTIACNVSPGNGGGAMSAKLVGCVVSNNISDVVAGISAYGGGLYKCDAYDSTITRNLITTEHSTTTICGGGLCESTASNCVVSGNAVANCGAKTKIGGGGHNTDFIDCRIIGNFCNVGAAMNGGNAAGCVISNNFSGNGRLIIRAVESLTDCDIWNASIDTAGAVMNTSICGYGAGWTIADSDNVYTSGYFSPMTGVASLILNTQGKTFLTNCLLAANTCDVLMSRPASSPPKLPIVNCTIVDNRIMSLFSGFNPEKGSLCEFVNCIICRNSNSTGTAAYDLSLYNVDDTYVSFRNCMIDPNRTSSWTPHAESGTVASANPRFDSGNALHPYSLRRSSPAFGAGEVQDWMACATDIRGDATLPRLRDGMVDIGCYQCHLIPVGTVFTLR